MPMINTTTAGVHPVFRQAETLYAFLGDYEEASVNNYAWTSWKNVKGTYHIILPYQVKRLAFYHSFEENIMIVNPDVSAETYVLKAKEVTAISSIHYGAQYDVMKSSGKIGTMKFCLTSSQGALSVITTDKNAKFEDNWTKIINDKDAWTEGIDVFSYKDPSSGAVICTDVSRIKTFKGRGNSTWRMDKKSFKIKFYEAKSCLGMEKTNSLRLKANYQDGTLMRNKFVYDMAHEAKLLSPDSRYLDLYVNGSYKGLYQLSEAAKIGKNKLVRVTDLEDATFKKAREATKDPDYNAWAAYANEAHGKTEKYKGGTIQYFDIPAEYNPDNITGGYLLEVNVKSHVSPVSSAFTTPQGQTVGVLSPEYCTEAQIKYIYDYFVQIETSLYGGDHDYLSLIDVESLAKTYIVQELGKNIDGGVTSTYFYKEKNALMYAGPAWDYDCALGNLIASRADEYGRKYDTNHSFGWFTKKIAIPGNRSERTFYTAACQIDHVWNTIRSVWDKEFMGAINIALGKKAPMGSRLKSIRDYGKMSTDAAHVNYLIHPLPGSFHWIPCKELSFEGQIEYVIDWLASRQKWLNDKILNTGPDFFVYLKQKRNWKPTAYFWKNEERTVEDEWPGGEMLDMGNSIYRITVSGGAGRIIFSNNGSVQTADLVIPGPHMVYDLDTEKWTKPIQKLLLN